MTLRMRIEVLEARSEQSPRSKLLLRQPSPVKLKALYHPCLVIASSFRRSVLPLLLPPTRAAISTLARLTTSMNATLATRCALPNTFKTCTNTFEMRRYQRRFVLCTWRSSLTSTSECDLFSSTGLWKCT